MGLQTHPTHQSAPFYDGALARTTQAARRESLAALPEAPGRILILASAPGWTCRYCRCYNTWGTRSYRRHAASLPRASAAWISSQFRGDSLRLPPFASASFDHAVLHLILAVVPGPTACRKWRASSRPGGSVLIFDKFLRGQPFPLRRLLSPVLRRVAA